MSSPMHEPAPSGFPGPDPGRSIRAWVALLLRMGIGLHLLGVGLAGYFGSRGGGPPGNFWGRGGRRCRCSTRSCRACLTWRSAWAWP